MRARLSVRFRLSPRLPIANLDDAEPDDFDADCGRRNAAFGTFAFRFNVHVLTRRKQLAFEQVFIATRERSDALRGDVVPHRSCGIAIAETFGRHHHISGTKGVDSPDVASVGLLLLGAWSWENSMATPIPGATTAVLKRAITV